MVKRLAKEFKENAKYKCTHEECQDRKEGKEMTLSELKEHLEKDCQEF